MCYEIEKLKDNDYILFLDESGNHREDDLFILGGFLIKKKEYVRLRNELYCWLYKNNLSFNMIHNSSIKKYERKCRKDNIKFEKFLSTIQDLISLIKSYDFKVFISIIDKNFYQNMRYEQGGKFILERVFFNVKHLKETKNKLIIVAESKNTKLIEIDPKKRIFRNIFRNEEMENVLVDVLRRGSYDINNKEFISLFTYKKYNELEKIKNFDKEISIVASNCLVVGNKLDTIGLVISDLMVSSLYTFLKEGLKYKYIKIILEDLIKSHLIRKQNTCIGFSIKIFEEGNYCKNKLKEILD